MAVNVANNPLGSYPVKTSTEGSGSGVVHIQHVNVDNAITATITGGTTEAKQDDANASLVSIDDKLTLTALTPASPTFATVGTSSAQALAANANRKGLILVNTSSNTISLGLGATAVLNSGITLTANGAFNMDKFSYTTAAINAIASGASSNLTIQEFS